MFVGRFQKLRTRIDDFPEELLDAFIELEQLATIQKAQRGTRAAASVHGAIEATPSGCHDARV